MASAAAEKTIPNAEQGKSCNIPLEDAGFFVRLGKKKASLDTCKSKCINDEFCEGIEYKAPRKCYLFYNTIDEVRPNRDELLAVHFDQYLLRISHLCLFKISNSLKMQMKTHTVDVSRMLRSKMRTPQWQVHHCLLPSTRNM